jgi:hypothetical protein
MGCGGQYVVLELCSEICGFEIEKKTLFLKTYTADRHSTARVVYPNL